jgi:hypothetical protein
VPTIVATASEVLKSCSINRWQPCIGEELVGPDLVAGISELRGSEPLHAEHRRLAASRIENRKGVEAQVARLPLVQVRHARQFTRKELAALLEASDLLALDGHRWRH